MNKIVFDCGFGDSGKGTIVDYLTHNTEAKWNVRYSGGPQCAHRVVLPNGKDHIFAQFGSGTLQGASTLYSENSLFNPLAWQKELERLDGLLDKPEKNFYVHENAIVIDAVHRKLNMADAKKNGHGSTGHGCWKALEMNLLYPELTIRVKDLKNANTLREKAEALFEKYVELEPSMLGYRRPIEFDVLLYEFVKSKILNIVDDDWIAKNLGNRNDIIFEGNQGFLIDPDYGFYPYVTANDATHLSAVKFIDKYLTNKEHEKVGVIRHYLSRHGPGFFPTEQKMVVLKEANKPQEFTGEMRYGYMDIPLMNYVATLVQLDTLAITCLDQDVLTSKICEAYEHSELTGIPYLEKPEVYDKQESLLRTQKLQTVEAPCYRNRISTVEILRDIYEPTKGMILSNGPTCKDKFLRN